MSKAFRSDSGFVLMNSSMRQYARSICKGAGNPKDCLRLAPTNPLPDEIVNSR
jgi:hypothetical protein